MSGRLRWWWCLCLAGGVLLASCLDRSGKRLPGEGEQAAVDPAARARLEQAVLTLRRVNLADLPEGEQKEKMALLDAAGKDIAAAGPAGAARLTQELTRLQAAGERDDGFKLAAASLLWLIGQLDQAQPIADIWSGEVDLSLHYNQVFGTALEAARTQDPRALPMLRALLKDDKGSLILSEKAIRISWPATTTILWNVYGSKGISVLQEIFEKTSEPATLEPAILVLTAAQHLPALPKIRKLAADGQGGVRTRAIWNLGIFGHPDDFDFLSSGLQSTDPLLARDFAFALYEYEDLRVVPLLVPLLHTQSDELREEVLVCLSRLMTPQSFEALYQFAMTEPVGSGTHRDHVAHAAGVVQKALLAMQLTWESFASLKAGSKQETVARLRDAEEQQFTLKPNDRPFTHADLLKALAEWQQQGRLGGGTYSWAETRHMLSASTPEDIGRWLDLKAKVSLRLSNDARPDLDIIDLIVKRLGRTRYRKEVGLSTKVASRVNPGGKSAKGI